MAFGVNPVKITKKAVRKAAVKSTPPPRRSGATEGPGPVIKGYIPKTPTVYTPEARASIQHGRQIEHKEAAHVQRQLQALRQLQQSKPAPIRHFKLPTPHKSYEAPQLPKAPKQPTQTPSKPSSPSEPRSFKLPQPGEKQPPLKPAKAPKLPKQKAPPREIKQAKQELHQARKAVRKSQPGLAGLTPIQREVAKLDKKAHRKYPDVPVSVMMGDTEQESNFDPAAVSSSAAVGLTQFIPSTAADYGVKEGTGRKEKRSQVFGQAHLLSDLEHEHPGGIKEALGNYYGDPEASYSSEVLEKAQKYRGLNKPGNPAAIHKLQLARAQAAKLGIPVGGPGPAPKKVVTRFKAIKKSAAELTKEHVPYVYGGGHGAFEESPKSLDCSGAVSWVLHKAGLLKAPLTSGAMGSVLAPGPGAVTVFYNAGHTFMRIGNEYWGTSVGDSGAGGLGPHPAPSKSYLSEYSVGHVPGLGKKQALQLGFSPQAVQSFPGMSLSSTGTTATITSGAGTTQSKPGFSKSPIKLSPQQKAKQTFAKLESVGIGSHSQKVSASESKVPNSELERLTKKYGKRSA